MLRWSLVRLIDAGIVFINLSIHAELGMVALGLNDSATALSEFREAVRYAISTTVSENSALALIGIAEIAVSAKHEVNAVKILASVDRWLSISGYRQGETESKLAKDAARRAKRQIGEEAFALAWEEGALLSIHEAAEIALSLDIHLSPSPLVAAQSNEGAKNYKLTKQERKVLCLMAAGETNHQIGNNLFISNRTVAVHVQNILRKLDAENRTHASALAYLAGICLPSATDHPA